MKKLFSVLAIGLMLAFGVNASMACDGPQCQEADVYLEQQAASHDYTFVGVGNDWAKAGASGWSYARQESEAKGLTYAGASGNVDSENWSDVWAGVSDWGTTSHSWAGAQTYGQTEAGGAAYGDNYYGICGTQFSKSVAAVGGSIFQANYAGETGYNSGQFAEAGGMSGADFKVVRYDVDRDRWHANTYASLGDNYYWYWWYDRPYAYTWGDSYATIDARGNERSASAWTSNGAYTYPGYGQGTLSEYTSSVFGSGFAQALSAKGNTYAYGNADFVYNGGNYGYGHAGVNTNIVNYGNYSSASASGYAYSNVGGGGICQ